MKDIKQIEKRRKFIKQYVNDQCNKGIKIQASVYELSERLFLSTRQIEHDLYRKPKNSPKSKY